MLLFFLNYEQSLNNLTFNLRAKDDLMEESERKTEMMIKRKRVSLFFIDYEKTEAW